MLFSNKTTLGLVALSTLVASSAATDAVRLGRRNLAANAEQNVEGEDLNGLRKLGKKKEKKGRKTRAPKVKKTRAPKGTTHPKTQKSGKSGKAEGALYHADLGTYGDFYLQVTDQGTMSWVSDLANLNHLPYFKLPTNLPANSVPDLGYHLHNKWVQGTGTKYEDTQGGCASDHTGGHYDPYLACGGASAQPASSCIPVHGLNYKAEYNCSYADSCYSTCEVGDLSGKYGNLDVDYYGGVHSVVEHDPFPALTCHYDETGMANDPFKFASVVFHAPGGDRVLCGKLEKVADGKGAKSSKSSSW